MSSEWTSLSDRASWLEAGDALSGVDELSATLHRLAAGLGLVARTAGRSRGRSGQSRPMTVPRPSSLVPRGEHAGA